MNQYRDTLRITHLFLQYSIHKNTNKTYCNQIYDELCNAIRLHVYTYPQRLNPNYSLEISGEFVIYIENKLYSFIDNFEYTGVPFEYYLNTVLKFQFYSFQKKYRKEIKEYKFFEHESIYTMLNIPTYTHEQTIIYESYNTNTTPFPISIKILNTLLKTAKNNKVFKKRLWWFILKYLHFFKDKDVLYALLQKCDISKNVFLLYESKTKDEIKSREIRSTNLEMQKNLYFSRCRKLELELQEDILTKKEKEATQHLLEKCKTKYALLFEKHKKCTLHPLLSNEELALLLHTPKGTVDSGIYFFQIKCREYYLNLIRNKKAH